LPEMQPRSYSTALTWSAKNCRLKPTAAS
jgi:hypothetical protein